MKNKVPAGDELNMAQVLADIYTAEAQLQRIEISEKRVAKYMKGLSGYHLQQAVEKMIKIQIYKAGIPIDFSKIYRHNIRDLVQYAQQLGIVLNIPVYIQKHDMMISSWEAEGRYDIHVVVRTDTLRKAYEVIKSWCQDLMELGYK